MNRYGILNKATVKYLPILPIPAFTGKYLPVNLPLQLQQQVASNQLTRINYEASQLFYRFVERS